MTEGTQGSLYGSRGWDNAPAPRPRKMKGGRRFWLPYPRDGNRAEVQVCFADGTPFFLTEHGFKINGSWKNWTPCILNMSDKGCPLCKLADRNNSLPINTYDAAALTVINMTGYTNKESGEEVKNYRELLIIKGETSKKFKAYDERKGGLRGCIYTVSRSAKKKESIGDDWDYDRKLTEEELVKEFGDNAEPLNYTELLPLKSYEELETICRQIMGEIPADTGGGAPSSPGTSTSPDDDSIPF